MSGGLRQRIRRAVDERVRDRDYRYDQHGTERGAPWTDGLLWSRSVGGGPSLRGRWWGVDLSEGAGGAQEFPAIPLDEITVYTIASPRDWPDALDLPAEDLVVNGDDPQAELAGLVCAGIWHLCGHGPSHPSFMCGRQGEPWDLYTRSFETYVWLSPFVRDVVIWLLVDTPPEIQGGFGLNASITIDLDGVSTPLDFRGYPREPIENYPIDLPVADYVPWRYVILRDVGTGRADGGGLRALTVSSSNPGPVLFGGAVHELHNSLLEQAG